jgi:hypothetical protein
MAGLRPPLVVAVALEHVGREPDVLLDHVLDGGQRVLDPVMKKPTGTQT